MRERFHRTAVVRALTILALGLMLCPHTSYVTRCHGDPRLWENVQRLWVAYFRVSVLHTLTLAALFCYGYVALRARDGSLRQYGGAAALAGTAMLLSLGALFLERGICEGLVSASIALIFLTEALRLGRFLGWR